MSLKIVYCDGKIIILEFTGYFGEFGIKEKHRVTLKVLKDEIVRNELRKMMREEA